MDTIDPREHDADLPEPMGDLEDVSLGSIDRTVRISTMLSLDLKRQLADFH